MIAEYKNVYYKNSDINSENFPMPDRIETENWKLIKMDEPFSSQEALDCIKAKGCRPANIYELLLWAKDNQKKSKWVLGFGSEWKDSDGNHRVPRVHRRSGGDWEFRLGYFEFDWFADYCLLGFCDSTLTPGHSSTESLDSLTLSRAIEICKEAGLKVIEEK